MNVCSIDEIYGKAGRAGAGSGGPGGPRQGDFELKIAAGPMKTEGIPKSGGSRRQIGRIGAKLA